MRAWIDVATLAKTKNLNGGLVARAASGLPLLLEEGLKLALVPPVLDAPRRVRVKALSFQGEDEAVVFFDEVADAGTAEMLVGCHCLARRDDVDLSALESPEGLPSWVGWQVFDEREGYVGTVCAVEDRPLQPLLHVERTDGRTTLVPLAEEFVVAVDEECRRVDLACPAGLLDL